MNIEDKKELQKIYQSRFQDKILHFLRNGYESFNSKKLYPMYPDCVFSASKIVQVHEIPAYYLLILAYPPISELHECRFRAIAQFHRTTGSGETFNVELLDVITFDQVENFFTELWTLMKCAKYH